MIADHVRSGVMLIGDGVTPANEGRGYVLRRLLRRTVRSARLLGVARAGAAARSPRSSATRWRPSYPELATDFERIAAVVAGRGGGVPADARRRLDASSTPRSPRPSRPAATQLPGDQAFQLHDTYGFPIDLTLEMAAEAGLTVDEQGFRTLMAEQRSRAKADAAARKTGYADLSAYRAVLDAAGGTEFTGYTELATEAHGRRAARRRRRRCPRRARATRSRCAGPHPVLRRGRRPAGRHRLDPRRRVRRRGRRRAEAGRRA